MGVWKKIASFRLDEPHLDLLREVGQMCDPPSENLSFNLRVLLNGFWSFLITGRMPRWMAELQRVHQQTVYADVVQESPVLEAGDGRRRAQLGTSEAAKRPPCRFVSRPKVREAGSVSVQVDAWPAPFCGRGPFAYFSPQRIA